MPLFVAMELVSSSAGGSGFGSTGLEIQSGVKKKVKPDVAGGVVDLFAGPLPTTLLYLGDKKHKVSWRSENDKSSISGVLDVENMVNTIAEKMSYAKLGKNDNMDIATLRKT
ncbi:hypothetical protein G9A89_020608 [Geosiphon pyriformis]|nr:hypothetical protein G9A89_020608 [Geosiphon pyriformis]